MKNVNSFKALTSFALFVLMAVISYSQKIHNRWVQLMFISDDASQGWKGDDMGGNEATSGVYYVILKYNALCSSEQGDIIYKGTVQLVR